MIEKLKNLIKIGVKKETTSASIASVDIAGTKKPVVMMMPYGMFANPANDIFSLVMQDQGNEESLFAIVFDKKNLEKLDDGEIALGIPAGKNRIFFKKNNDIIVQNENGVMTLKASGQLDVNGNFTVDP